MRPVAPDEALNRILERTEALPDEERPIGEVLDHILAEEVRSRTAATRDSGVSASPGTPAAGWAVGSTTETSLYRAEKQAQE